VIAQVAIFIAGVALAAFGQVLMKKGAIRGRNRPVVLSFFDPFVITGYALMLASTVTSTIALKVLPLKLTVALLPLGYIVVVLLSVLLLHERMRRHHLWGMLIILTGIVIFNLGAR
jgi:small multidrug resistance pump